MSALHRLLTHLDRLRSQHKAGVVPPSGELEELWDLAADVRGDLANGFVTAAPSKSALSPTPFQVRFIAEVLDPESGAVHLRQPVTFMGNDGGGS